MCLAVPAKITETDEIGENRLGIVELAGTKRQVFLDFVPDAQVGDYVLVHAGFALNRLSDQEARETYELLQQVATPEP